MKTSKKTVVQKVCTRLSIVMLALNAIAIIIVLTYARAALLKADESYLTEVVDNIGSTIDTTIDAYYNTAEIIAANRNVKELVQDSSKTSSMVNHPNVSNVLAELQEIVTSYQGSVVNITILSVAEDSYIQSDGTVSVRDTVTDRSYYQAVTQKKTILTDPYVQSQNNTRVISTSAPIYGNNGSVIGCVVVNIPTSFVSQLISDIGSTGGTWVMDSSHNVLAHSNSSYIGENYSVVGVSGSEFTTELSNPTGKLIEYDRNGTTRTGSIGMIDNSGWYLVAGIDTAEFEGETLNLAIYLLVVQVICVIASIVACGLNVYRYLNPLKDLNLAMQEMSKGNLNHELHHVSDDEIGELSENLRTTMTNLSIYIHDIEENLNAFGHGDFTRESDVEYLGDFHSIQVGTDDFRSLITNTLDALTMTVEQVTSGSEYVASGAQNLAEGSTKQAESITDLNMFVNDISKQISDNANSVLEVNKTAQTISTDLNNSNQQMDEMMLAMEDIREKSEGITKIIKTIEDVAFQTNILALNAAVEAARAGTAGRGFAVVAEEVRNLSSRTSEAVHNTTTLIEETTSAVSKGNAVANATTENLKTITTEISGFISTLDEIASATEQQAVSIERISQNVHEISDVMQSNSAVSEESAATSQELSSQAAVMQESIGQFKLRN